MQGHPLRRTPFSHGEMQNTVSCTECSQVPGFIHTTGHAHIQLSISKYT